MLAADEECGKIKGNGEDSLDCEQLVDCCTKCKMISGTYNDFLVDDVRTQVVVH